MSSNGNAPELVNIKIDGKPLQVAKGANIIEVAKSIGVEIPHYCYHPDLTIAGNCRMCKVEIAGAPKLEIGCNLGAREGLEVSTGATSQRVRDTQAATLEFILVNHPLDCTVCDQAGHCKLQDYHYEYNARPSRFLEEKEHKVKAEPLGPTVMLDGERCIMCTRCIRFCDEITKTSELGMLNRGDRAVIAVNQDRPLDNALSGTVVDLCPVGALTHREWRFNTRIWFTKQTDSICPGCSTGCNVKVAERDGEIVQVKARYNGEVNKEWLCDEGRYGFGRFQPTKRVVSPMVSQKSVSLDQALKAAESLAGGETLVMLSPDLLLEDYVTVKSFCEKVLKSFTVSVAYRERTLTDVQKIVVSPDYACNYQAAVFAGLVRGDLQKGYNDALAKIREGAVERVLCIGDRSILPGDATPDILRGLASARVGVGILADAESGLAASLATVFPGRSILEKSGFGVSRAERLQYFDRVIDFPAGTDPEWRVLNKIALSQRVTLTTAASDRDISLELLRTDPRLVGLRIQNVKQGGVDLRTYTPRNVQGEGSAALPAN